MQKVLEVDGLNKSFHMNKKNIHILDDISISLEKGDFLTILGPSGCGKSTLIRCICCFEKIDSGIIKVDGIPVNKPGPDRLMVFQEFNQLFHWKTVWENIIYPLNLNHRNKTKKEKEEIAGRFLEMVKLKDFKNAYPKQLSGGMCQRVAIARALAIGPKILLMDEPFGALDAQTRSILQKELMDIWNKTEIIIIFITHNIQESILLGNKIIVLSQIPAVIKVMIDNTMPFPRKPETPEFMDLWNKLYSTLDVKRF
ncbi:MAG: ABC transporter ATP-binding protein [Actinomycetota bacterium]|nr:ABC transporter ATP-binding protein [Actinomycetota bacterium]